MSNMLDMYKCGRGEPPLSCFTEPMVTILVGPKKDKFQVHKGLLVRYSGYFRGCLLNSQFTEAQENQVNLDTEDPAIFRLVALWLYTGKATASFITIDMNNGKAYPNSSADESLSMLTQETLFALWIFADTRLMPALCNYVVNLTFAAISPSYGLKFNEDVPRIVFENTLNNAAIRELVVEAAAMGGARETGLMDKLDAGGGSSAWLQEFLQETTVRTKELAAQGQLSGSSNSRSYWARLDVCKYHQHEADSAMDVTSSPLTEHFDSFLSTSEKFHKKKGKRHTKSSQLSTETDVKSDAELPEHEEAWDGNQPVY